MDIDTLLQNGDWQELWQTLPTLPLFRASQVLAVIRDAGWKPEDEATRNRVGRAIDCLRAVQHAYRAKGSLLMPQIRIPLPSSVRAMGLMADGLLTVLTMPTRPGDDHTQLFVLDPLTGTVQSSLLFPRSGYTRMECADGVAATVCNGFVDVWELPGLTKRSVPSLDMPEPPVRVPTQWGHLEVSTDFGNFAQVAMLPKRQLILACKRTDSWKLNRVRIVSTRDWSFRDTEPSRSAGDPWCMAISPDSKTVAVGVGQGDNTVSVWEIDSGRLLADLAGHAKGVRKTVFSPDGRLLATASYDTTVKLWSVANWSEVASLPLPPAHNKYGDRDGYPQYCVAFSPDGKSLAAISGNRLASDRGCYITLYEVPSLMPIRRMAACSNKPDRFRFLAHGAAIVTGANEGRGPVQVFATSDGRLLHEVGPATHVVCNASGSRMYVATTGRYPELYTYRLDLLELALARPADMRNTTLDNMTMEAGDPSDRSLATALLQLKLAIGHVTGHGQNARSTVRQ